MLTFTSALFKMVRWNVFMKQKYQAGMKFGLNFRNATCHSVQNLAEDSAVLPFLYVCETWFSTLGEECTFRLGVFWTKVSIRALRPKREEVTGGWRKPHCDELHNFYC
jgi:hypothetical protein